jgi:hypothetical protein
VAIPQCDVDRWDPGWKVLACGYEMGPGYKPDFAGRAHVLLLVPRRDGPAVMEGRVDVPENGKPVLTIPTSSFGIGEWEGDYRLRVFVNDERCLDKRICTLGKFTVEKVDVSRHRGQAILLRLEAHQEGEYYWERAYFGRIGFE